MHSIDRKARHWSRLSTWLTRGLVGVLFLLLAGAAPASAGPAGAVPTLHWHKIIIDSDESPGEFAELAFEPSTGVPHIAYYDTDSEPGAFLAHPVSSGGNCGPDATWLCSDLPGSTSQGEHITLAFASSCKRGIVFYDAAVSGNRFDGRDTCVPTTTNILLDTPFDITHITGHFNSLKYDPSGTAHLAYVHTAVGTNYLRYATTISTTGCAYQWECDDIDVGAGVGQNASLGVTIGGYARIAYQGPAGSIRLASRLPGATGNCGPLSTWQCDKVADGFQPSLYVPQCSICSTSDRMRIAYFNGLTLQVARSVTGNSGNCGFGSLQNDWQCDVIETVGSSPERDVSLAMVDGSPVIAYQDSDDTDHDILKIARPAVSGNCGPGNTWQCDVVDDGFRGPYPHDVGSVVSLASAPNGRLYIAYFDDTFDDLVLAFQIYPLYLPLIVR